MENQDSFFLLDDALSDVEDSADESELDDETDDAKSPDDVEFDDEQDTDDNTSEDESADETESVILARDGKHTIPFEKLREARENAKTWKSKYQDLQAEMDRLKANEVVSENSDKPDVSDEIDADDFAFDKGSIKGLVEKAVNDIVSQRLSNIEQQYERDLVRKHVEAIYTAHPDADSIQESREFAGWIDSLPSYVKSSVKQIIQQGTSEQVIDMLNDFKKSQGKTDIAYQAKDKVAKAQTKASVPDTLSDFPASKANTKSGFDALRQMSGAELLNALNGKSDEEIDAFLDRIV